MTPDFDSLDQFLESPDNTWDDKVHGCMTILARFHAGDPTPVHVRGKCACHLGYRALEGDYVAEIHEILAATEKTMMTRSPRNASAEQARWWCSVRMVRLYLAAQAGDLTSVFSFATSMDCLNWMGVHPAGAVNCCRALALGMAVCAARHDTRSAEFFRLACHSMFRKAIKHFDSSNQPFRAGHEMVQAAKACHTTVALLPLCGLPYQGHAYDAETIIRDTQDHELMRNALRSILLPEKAIAG